MNYLIALSGGLDSAVLLDLFQKKCALHAVRAVHIHHGLHADADQWAMHCQNLCDQLNIPLEIERVSLDLNSGESLEAMARNARYAVCARHLKPNEVLVTAHHQDDQAETLLLHAVRGAGPKGLAAMPVLKEFSQGLHWRPLLTCSRSALHGYALQHNLSWVDDDSNDNIAFDRNFLRHEIIPKLKQRWPKALENLTRVAEIQAELSNFLDELLIPYWPLITLHSKQLDIHPDYTNNPMLPLSILKPLPETLKNWLLRAWIQKISAVILSRKQLQLIIEEMMLAKADKNPQLKVGRFILRRYANALWLTQTESKIERDEKIQHCIAVVHEKTKLPIDKLTVQFRQGGEVLQYKNHSRSLKELLHTWRIPPWERAQVPLIYYDDLLVSVGTHILIRHT